MSLVPTCDGCRAVIEEKRNPRVTGEGAPGRGGGPVAVQPGERFDFCVGCTVAAFTAVVVHQDLVRALRARNMLDNDSMLRLQEYLRDPLSPADLEKLRPLTANERTAELQRRYGGPLNWRVAQVALDVQFEHIQV